MGRTNSRASRPRPPFVVDLEPVGLRVEVPAGTTLLAAARSAGVELQSTCGGAGTCDGCRVRVVSGEMSAPRDIEWDALGKGDLAAGFRLACQAVPVGDVCLDIPPESLTASQRVQVEGEQEEVAPALACPEAARLGLAIDIGTTKLAVYLVDLESGRTIARRGSMNPQIAFGEDVISRIAYTDRSPDGERTLRRRLVDALNRSVEDLCSESDASPARIAEVVAVGNTVMHHIFAGLPVHSLGMAPYRPFTTDPLDFEAREAGLGLAPGARVYMPPNIAGYVGADHVAMLLAAGLGQTGRTVLAIDIGTNTEISLAAGGRLTSCSSPSGPAFEGAHIGAGMRAAPGAIERVQIAGAEVSTYTIGRVPPVGICGSGILDAVSEMLRTGALDSRGNLLERGPGMRVRDGRTELVLAPASRTGHGRDIVVTRGDVNEIQLAKAAIRAGIDVLLEQAGLETGALEEVVVAGAFGSYLDLASAARIGLFPGLPLGRFRQVGNAAGMGARQMLVSGERRRAGEEIAGRVEYVELTGHPAFHGRFVEALRFGAW